MSDALTLADLLSRNVAVQWHEAVAVVRGVAQRLIEKTDHPSTFPELHQIAIAPDGRVDVTGGSKMSDDPVRRLGQLLQATFSQADAPVQLRLVIAQATAPSPLFGSIHAVDQALVYFERPDRGAVLQALYARAAALPPSSAVSRPTLDAIAPLSTPEERERLRVRAAARRCFAKRAVITGLAAGVCTAAVWYARTSGVTTTLGAPAAKEAVERLSRRVGAATRSGLSAASQRAGFGRLIFKEDAGAESPAPAAPKAAPVPVGTRTPSGRPTARSVSGAGPVASGLPVAPEPQSAPPLAFDLGPAPVTEAPPVVVASSVDAAGSIAIAGAIAAPAAPLDGVTARDREPNREPVVYSAESADVSPPIGVRPQLPMELPPQVRRADLLTVELMVLPDGTVDSVKALGTPRDMQDGVWLSAVKAFQFLPAMKDGVPVKYRKTIWIASR